MTKVIATSYPPQPGELYPAALTQYCMNGDAYIPATDALPDLLWRPPGQLLRLPGGPAGAASAEEAVAEGNRLYLGRTLRYESDASERLALLLADQTVLTPGFRIKFRLEV